MTPIAWAYAPVNNQTVPTRVPQMGHETDRKQTGKRNDKQSREGCTKVEQDREQVQVRSCSTHRTEQKRIKKLEQIKYEQFREQVQ
jgi:hypothetical protein